MNLLMSVKILYYPRRNKSIPINPLNIYPEDMGLYRTVSYVPAAVVLLNKVDGLTKEELLSQVPGLMEFVDRGFNDKVIVSFNPVVTVSIENKDMHCGRLEDWLARHLADTSLRPGGC